MHEWDYSVDEADLDKEELKLRTWYAYGLSPYDRGPLPGPYPLFYLGTHIVSWLWNGKAKGPLFVSARRLRERKTAFPIAQVPYAIDSGGFSELSMHGEWRTDPFEYADLVRRCADELGPPDWAAIQDWMVEPEIRKKTGMSIESHQRETCESFIILQDEAPGIRWLPVLQGWAPRDYLKHLEIYKEYGVHLHLMQVTGVGSVCRRQGMKEIAQLLGELQSRGLRLHGFGVKRTGLRQAARHLVSADSMAWSVEGRRERQKSGTSKSLQNDQAYAERWRKLVLEDLAAGAKEPPASSRKPRTAPTRKSPKKPASKGNRAATLKRVQTPAPKPAKKIAVEDGWGHGWRPTTGAIVYTHIIRSKDDYPEKTRKERKPSPQAWRKLFRDETKADWKKKILQLLKDRKPRTFNGIMTELTDGEMTADRALGKAPDDALWELAVEGKIEHTLEAPILWRKRR